MTFELGVYSFGNTPRLPDQAARLHKAIEATTAAGILPRDVGDTASTGDVTTALIDAPHA
ncbi:3-isopropylmalate dehydrogenase [Streptomyces lincolnensis]|uniref:3-isopropylmalate dehydrogenase n=1 Tax=Streptomyces lincolnensis TaxID=1915 RepID=A0A1B1M3Y4_STRLN|nr:hypothetical protein [Streptomyces lincolnensis]ANS63137.1 3-isopropylmalate dehydrogenase [Streptomyces lincolnensis]AXG52061.1 3-isopropylmalate dehydrogenase [Streptomyces lincolnensis]